MFADKYMREEITKYIHKKLEVDMNVRKYDELDIMGFLKKHEDLENENEELKKKYENMCTRYELLRDGK